MVKKTVSSYCALLGRGVRSAGQMSLPSSLREFQNLITAEALGENYNICCHFPNFSIVHIYRISHHPVKGGGRLHVITLFGEGFWVSCAQSRWLHFES